MWKLKVAGMTCAGCVAAVTKALLYRDPEAHVHAELDAKTVMVRSHRKEQEIREAIESAGFTVVDALLVA